MLTCSAKGVLDCELIYWRNKFNMSTYKTDLNKWHVGKFSIFQTLFPPSMRRSDMDMPHMLSSNVEINRKRKLSPVSFTARDMAQWLERGALPMSLPAVQFRIPLGAWFIMFLYSQSWDIVKMVCLWARHFTLKCFTWLR